MIGKVLAAVLGADIAEHEGDSGVVGAVLGVAMAAIVKRVIPLAIVGAGILVAKHYIEKAAAEA